MSQTSPQTSTQTSTQSRPQGTVRHLLADDDLSADEQRQILDLAAELKAVPVTPAFADKCVAVIFDKASTRTRVSFEVGLRELGGHAVLLDGATSQMGRGESIADTARVLGRQVHAIVWRTGAQERIEEMARFAGIPVVNALTDDYHPCQVLADLQTIREHKHTLAGLTLAYLGDGANNMAHSYVLGGVLAGLHVRIGAPEGFQPDADIVRRAEGIAAATGGSITITDDARAAVAGADAVATDTWVSMGQETQNEVRSTVFGDYRVSAELMGHADPHAIVLHCLPAYRGKEIDAEVLDGPQAVIWDQAENRRHVQKAVLILLERWSRE